jgi:hypothetical protein
MITIQEEQQTTNSDVMAILGMSPEKSVEDLVSAARQNKENELNQYERILYKIGLRRAELQSELNKLGSQFRQIEFLMQDTKKAICVLRGEAAVKHTPAPAPVKTAVEQVEIKPRYVAQTQALVQNILECFRTAEHVHLSVREIGEACGLPPYAISNFIHGHNRKINLLELSEIRYRAGNDASKFYQLTSKHKTV